MISRKRFNKERMLYGTLLETLILFLFILLAIASIYQVKFKENNLVRPGHEQLPKVVLDKMKEKLVFFEDEHGPYESLDILLTSLEDSVKLLKRELMEGIMPPPCILSNGEQRLFEVDFLADTTFIIKTINLNSHIIFRGDTLVKKDDYYHLTKKEFRKWAKDLHDSKKINQGDPECDPSINAKEWRSAHCYECKYVYVNGDLNFEAELFINVPEYLLQKPVSKNLTRHMVMVIQNYFFPSKREKNQVSSGE